MHTGRAFCFRAEGLSYGEAGAAWQNMMHPEETAAGVTGDLRQALPIGLLTLQYKAAPPVFRILKRLKLQSSADLQKGVFSAAGCAFGKYPDAVRKYLPVLERREYHRRYRLLLIQFMPDDTA